MHELDIDEKEKRAKLVVEKYEGIVHEAFYIHSVMYSAGRCLESFDRYHQLKNEEISPEYLICIVQEAVGHAAALSRYFWPSPGGKKNEPNQRILKESRGKRLRKSFGLDKKSALHNRDLRNAWEHFDERLDQYLLQNGAGFFFPNCIVGSHLLADDPVGHIFKLLDTEAECLVLMGKKHFFIPIYDEVLLIFNKAREADGKGTRLNTESSAL
jgi:hypothetical protein